MTASAFERLKFLIVDDNADMRNLLRRLLGSLGIRDITEATDGQTGMEKLRFNKYDVVLSDLEMKPMNGIEFTRAVRASEDRAIAAMPIIMISGHTEIQYIQAARDAGITEFIVKPVTPKGLISRITEIVERPRAFVHSTAYIGPDRRRKNRTTPGGPLRRQDDSKDVTVKLQQGNGS